MSLLTCTAAWVPVIATVHLYWLQTVNFETGEDDADSRKKYLTAKYGSHQMALIRKRLHVEMWLLEEMGKLYRQTGVREPAELPEAGVSVVSCLGEALGSVV